VCDGVEVTAYYAGHVLGAAMLHVRVGSESLVYTGAMFPRVVVLKIKKEGYQPYNTSIKHQVSCYSILS
jgi:predicted metal-dependent RNase